MPFYGVGGEILAPHSKKRKEKIIKRGGVGRENAQLGIRIGYSGKKGRGLGGGGDLKVRGQSKTNQ